MRIRILTTAVLATVLTSTAACSETKADSPTVAAPTGSSAAGGATAGAASGTITVLAASSLTETFNKIGADFKAANPKVNVTFSYGASSALAQQITSGSPADVFAAASPTTMKTVTDAGDAVGTPATFVKNQLVIAVAKHDPKKIVSLAGLTKPGLKVALCAAQVPCGSAATKVLAAAKVKLTPVTLEQDVKSALAKVKLGEVDAALVYRTDAKAAANTVDGIEFPESSGAINPYPIVVLKGAGNPTVAAAFVAFVQTAPEVKVLTDAGFQLP